MSVNVAVTVVSAPSVTVQVPVPVHPPPDQPVNVEPASGVAVSVRLVPVTYVALHVAPQLMPGSELVIEPVPVPAFETVSVRFASNVAVVDMLELSGTTQVLFVPLQFPVQPVNVDPAAAVAVSVTVVPGAKVAEQVAPQLIPAGLLVTVPDPEPALDTVRDGLPPVVANVAVTDVAALIVTTQVPVPVQPPPDQPVKVEPASATAVSVTDVPLTYAAEHVAPHVIPAGLLVTEPVPVPFLLTVSVRFASKFAVTDVAAVIATTQVPVPEQPPPDQPVKTEPLSAAAVSVTEVPCGNVVEHVAPQVMPAGALVTEPVPVPVLLTVSARGARLNVAVTVVSAVRLTTHVPVPVQPPPDQPANTEVASGVAVSVTDVALVKLAAQVPPHVMPVGALETEPVPVPAFATVRFRSASKFAVTLVSAVRFTTQVPVPVQPPPDQPVNTDPAVAVGVSVMLVPDR
jgi:hypothetical protein